ncbi:MAG TPA: spermidine synthase, partial [Vicinamibacteria bacterium]|nr:spermidine synthase [Vicinamibacteria bacterium]
MSRGRAALGPIGAAFFASGAAALVYQVVWQRVLALHTGVGIYSVALIVGAFLAGLGIGSHLGGVLSVRLSPRRALLGFGLVELSLSLFAVLS